MPIDYQQVYKRIKEIGESAGERRKTLEERRERARAWFAEYAGQLDALRGKVEAAKALDGNIRCALPVKERLDAHVPAGPTPKGATLIAVDGSQINPDRHAALEFCLVNVGAIVLRMDSGEAPVIRTQSDLFYGAELEENRLTGEGAVSLRRDLNERIFVEELSKDLEGTLINFTDGTIEIWGAKDIEDPKAYEESVRAYVTILSRLQSRGVITAGYVEKPGTDLVVRLLEIAKAKMESREDLRAYRPLYGVSDLWLFGERRQPLLGPGERSAVFGLQSGSEKYYKGPLFLHFFYLNVGTQGHPWPVRVEIPKWVADDPAKLDLVQAALIHQCGMLGSKPYPYLLHRAHETAVVKHEEKEQVEQMLAQELWHQQDEMGELSSKQSAKGLRGRGSFGRRNG